MEEIYESPERGTAVILHATLNTLKPQVLTANNNRTDLSSLYKTLATKAESTTSLKSLYDYHPSTELDSETKETIAITTGNWYKEYCLIHPCDDSIQVRKDYDYPLLLPVVIQLIAIEQVGETITIDTNPSPPDHLNTDTQIASLPITYPICGREHNHITQSNTCSLDNIIAILSSKKANILDALNLIGISLTEPNITNWFKQAASNKFDELRDYLAKQLGLQINYDATVLIRSYDFFGSEGTIIQLLRSEELCNDKYTAIFKWHHYIKTFNTTCMIGTIGSVITNLESSINSKIIPTKCKSCGSSEAICERLSGHFQIIPM